MLHDQRLKKLEEHLIQEHKQSAITAYLKEVIYGGIDGIIQLMIAQLNWQILHIFNRCDIHGRGVNGRIERYQNTDVMALPVKKAG